MILPRILLRVNFFRIVLDGVVSASVSFRRDMIYTPAWSSVGSSWEASVSTALIAAESVFSTYFPTVAAMDLLSRTFVQPLLLGFLSCHSPSSFFCYLDIVAYSEGLWYQR